MPSPRQPKEVFVVRSDRPYGFEDVMRERSRMMMQELFDVHEQPAVKEVSSTDDELAERVAQLEEEVARFREFALERHRVRSRLVIVKEVSHQQAKQLVGDYLKEHEAADTEELLFNLGVGLRTLVEVIDELKAEGKIKAAESN